jgi:hypothetical protein
MPIADYRHCPASEAIRIDGKKGECVYGAMTVEPHG